MPLISIIFEIFSLPGQYCGKDAFDVARIESKWQGANEFSLDATFSIVIVNVMLGSCLTVA